MQAIPKVTTSIAWLESRLLTPERAVDDLCRIASMGRCITIFEHFFPKQLDLFRAMPVTRPQVRQEIIARFHELVSDNLFPLLDCYVEEEGLDQFDLTINIYPASSDWQENRPDHYDDLTRAILLGAGALTEDGYMVCYDLPVFDFDRLHKRLRSRPLCYLWEATSILARRTDNDFLDFTMEDLYSGYILLPEWSIEQVEALRDEWNEAQKMIARFRELTIWVGTKPNAFQTVRRLVADALPKEDQEEPSGRALIEILA